MTAPVLPPADELLAYLASREEHLVDLLQRLSAAESPSDVPSAQKEVREIIATELENRAFAVKRVPGRKSGGMLHARPARRTHGGAAQLILGHFDTVWPLGTLESMPFEREGDRVRGPGVYDMKGGVAQALLSLDAIRHFGLQPSVTPHLFFNSDEEIGSRESRRYIERLAPAMDRVFVLEPSLGPSGKLKTTRKGIGRFTVTVTGEAAHAGLDPGRGASAILELSHVIQELFALNDLERGVTVNVGTIDGGLRPNVIAPSSQAVVDVRVETAEDAERIEKAIRGLQPATPGTSLTIDGLFGRPALEHTPANRKLWRLACRLGDELGLELEEGTAGGGSDGNFTSLYTATLDGMGAVGDGAHARHEHLQLQPTLERAALLVMLLLAPPLKDCVTEAA
ncbi:MAG: M20 family metallopeptidase [Xanthomonadales bacterium]|nr:M20 family metallopeptidase [Gammaproteobacteria bacterium]MBT8051376.1 M20 family metallopeptidase [Gammaproteobacteria bacterium]MBT8056922.1 M20 family metallopeptidase [Gammaproteobacteria bacterium]NNJ78887.1 M20 family metallopeptidase [Xanthomonadales bacterium]NNL05942.1 M20 family metallopeptidase [Xanthomonadales bacterium]